MATEQRVRKIVKIDEEKCNGCGDCAPSCAEGAIKIINGKARLVADNLCDGLGACLGHCPMGAIMVEDRLAGDFDESAVEKHLGHKPQPHAVPAPVFTPVSVQSQPAAAQHGGCPGSRMRVFDAPANQPKQSIGMGSGESMLRQWPVQLTLLPTTGPIWQNADVLLAADCVPFAQPDFHSTMLVGKTLAIACPKLDNVEPYIDKLATIIAGNSIRSITIARMEVPCCYGLVRIVQLAMAKAGVTDIPVQETVISIRGAVK